MSGSRPGGAELCTKLGVLSWQPGLMQKYQLREFERLVAAFREGNPRVYSEELDKYRDEFISRGVYLILERLLNVVYRNFFKKL